MIWLFILNLHHAIKNVSCIENTNPFFRKIFFISSYTDLLYELIQDLPYFLIVYHIKLPPLNVTFLLCLCVMGATPMYVNYISE